MSLIANQFDLTLPLGDRINQSVFNSCCPFCNREDRKSAYNFNLIINCQYCYQQHQVKTEICFQHYNYISQIISIKLSNSRYSYYLNTPMPNFNSIRDLQTQKLYYLPRQIILSPENFNQIDNILLLL